MDYSWDKHLEFLRDVRIASQESMQVMSIPEP
jgi:hypothetical protein